MSWRPGQELSFMLGDMPLEEFFDRHWEKRAVVLPGAKGRFDALYDAERFWRKEHLREIDAASVDEAGVQTQVEIAASRIDEVYAGGLTICADVSQDPRVSPYLTGLKSSLALVGAGAFAKIYASPDEHGFAIHADAYHVFVLQLDGNKRWRYSKSPATTAPIAGFKRRPSGEVVCVSPFDGVPARADDGSPLTAPKPEDLEEVVLTEGDALYLPPGTWHEARAIGASIALSVSPPRSAMIEVLTTLVSDTLLSDAAFREDAVLRPDDPGRTTATLAKRFAAFQAHVAALRPEEIVQRWCETATRQRRPHIVAPLAYEPERTDRLTRTDPDPILYFQTEEMIHFYLGGQAWSFPAEALPLVRGLNAHQAFVAEDVLVWDANLDWDGARHVLAQLCAAGALSRVD